MQSWENLETQFCKILPERLIPNCTTPKNDIRVNYKAIICVVKTKSCQKLSIPSVIEVHFRWIHFLNWFFCHFLFANDFVYSIFKKPSCKFYEIIYLLFTARRKSFTKWSQLVKNFLATFQKTKLILVVISCC